MIKVQTEFSLYVLNLLQFLLSHCEVVKVKLSPKSNVVCVHRVH